MSALKVPVKVKDNTSQLADRFRRAASKVMRTAITAACKAWQDRMLAELREAQCSGPRLGRKYRSLPSRSARGRRPRQHVLAKLAARQDRGNADDQSADVRLQGNARIHGSGRGSQARSHGEILESRMGRRRQGGRGVQQGLSQGAGAGVEAGRTALSCPP